MKQGTQSQCSGTTWRDKVGREVGDGFRMGGRMYTYADSYWCMAKPSQYGKVIILQLNKHI